MAARQQTSDDKPEPFLKNKHILLGICGSIAAYKAAPLTRLLIKAGATVKVVMTRSATEFITPLTLTTLSKHPVTTDLIDQDAQAWNNHVELGLWADLFLIAPASANTLAKMAHGQCDNMLLATYLSAKCPVYFAPAMDLDMWQHPATQQNIQQLHNYGNTLIPVEHGELASGLVGDGRMAEPEHILEFLKKKLISDKGNALQGKTILITAGPTHEAIDPVRYISNHSSGKMGKALAAAAAHQGAKVILVSGPVNWSIQHPNINYIPVTSAAEMYDACMQAFPGCDVGIMAAAVADYRPATIAAQKIKKKDAGMHIALEKTNDILETLGKMKAHQLLIGFALETENERKHAAEKLEKKNLDFIVLNSLNDEGAGFGHDTNKITIIRKDNKIKDFELKTKTAVATDILNEISTLLHA